MECKIKGSIKYFDNYCTYYRIVVEKFEKDCYVNFKVYIVNEEDVQSMIDCSIETFSGDYAFGAMVSYKHVFPHYGEEKESSGKYHAQIHGLEDLKRWHDTIYNICEIMKRNYC
jgi:hypothetical protein